MMNSDRRTVAFADLRGNKQYISVGNLEGDDRVALFFMDYAHQERLKILGHARVVEEGPEAEKLLAQLRVPGEKSVAERAVVITVEAFDWNCPQHITPRWTAEELQEQGIETGLKPPIDVVGQSSTRDQEQSTVHR
jgi:uncharacterized protein